MKINKVEIRNWRSFIYENIQFQDLIILIGQNNSGKSNVLSSLLFFFGELKAQEFDFNGESSELSVEIEFFDLKESEKATFQKYVSLENTIKVKKTAKKDGSFSYDLNAGGFIQEPDENWLKESNISEYLPK